MTEPQLIQNKLDRVAISASVFCMIHCLATPFILIALPALGVALSADEVFHQLMLVFVLPISVIALLLGCRQHRDRIVLLLGITALLLLVLLAFFGHVWLGEAGEQWATILSSLILVIAHIRNYRLSRRRNGGVYRRERYEYLCLHSDAECCQHGSYDAGK